MTTEALPHCMNQNKRLRNDQVTTIEGGLGGWSSPRGLEEGPRGLDLIGLDGLDLIGWIGLDWIDGIGLD